MRQQLSVMMALIICPLASLCSPAPALAAESTKFTAPAEVMSAAEDAFGKGKFDALADCFDAGGQRQMAQSYVGIFVMELSEGSGPGVKKIKDLLAKFGLTDIAKKAGETDEQLADRLAAQLKDPRAFMIKATPLAFPNPKSKGPIKGELKDVKIDGQKAQAKYAVKLSGTNAMTQDVTFAQVNGSWKIAKAIVFVSPEE
jgi:hypothetical protein